jgi:hypothetical protein
LNGRRRVDGGKWYYKKEFDPTLSAYIFWVDCDNVYLSEGVVILTMGCDHAPGALFVAGLVLFLLDRALHSQMLKFPFDAVQ